MGPVMKLRNYQQRAIEDLYNWFQRSTGNPCMVLPTGAGKSHIIAALCHDALRNWPTTQILMLTHVKELIEQNAQKLRQHWLGAPMGIYSASIGKKQLGEPITFAGIQSVRDKATLIGHVDLIIIDECHLVSHKDEGGYRKLIGNLQAINPLLRVIGLTATPYRLGHGLITDKPALFDDLLESVTIEELVYKGFLAPLRSKITGIKFDLSGVHKRGGEFIESELQAAVDTEDKNQAVVDKVISLAGERKAWLFFCTGVKHAQHIAAVLQSREIAAECVTGETPKKERERILADFKAGRLQALTNANVLTTGFDYPDIDLIAMLRPTMSPALYVQMAGRGMRPKSHTDHCLVLDFAGVVETHGPITAVQPPKKKGDGTGEAPVKVCDECHEIVHISAQICPACGNPFPPPPPKPMNLRDDDIMGLEGYDMQIKEWQWRKHLSRTSGKEMLAVTYYGENLSDHPVTEYFPVTHDGYAGEKARRNVAIIANQAGAKIDIESEDILNIMSVRLSDAQHPQAIEYRQDGKFFRVVKREWE